MWEVWGNAWILPKNFSTLFNPAPCYRQRQALLFNTLHLGRSSHRKEHIPRSCLSNFVGLVMIRRERRGDCLKKIFKCLFNVQEYECSHRKTGTFNRPEPPFGVGSNGDHNQQSTNCLLTVSATSTTGPRSSSSSRSSIVVVVVVA